MLIKFMYCFKYLNEGFNFGALVDFVFAHPLVHFARIPVDASDECMAIGFVRCTLVVVLNDNSFTARVPAAQDQHHLPRFHNLTHLRWI